MHMTSMQLVASLAIPYVHINFRLRFRVGNFQMSLGVYVFIYLFIHLFIYALIN